jgi:very-short-patch-repair endonuclease
LKNAISACERMLSDRQRVLDQVRELLKLDAAYPGLIAKANSDLRLPDAEPFWSGIATRVAELEPLVRYLQVRDECVAENLNSLTDLSDFWTRAPHHLVDLFEYARVSQLLAIAFEAHPALAQFDASGHNGWVETFENSDAEALQRARKSIASQHSGSIPRSTSANGQLGVLLREFEKKARHLAVRQLMLKAGNAIQAMKPVFMMSPLSVANFLPPGTVEFDLVVFDEASQVKPSDALGAIVRGKQSVVVGDSKQLPPTSFFDTMVVGDDLADEDEGTATSDIESVLGLFCSRGAHQRMLRWHYRSRHESLITVSNHLFYDDKLVVFPSPDSHKERVGLIYRRVPNGVYDRSASRTNRVEAKAIATAVMQHANEQMQLPREQRQTLGVGALSKAQMDAILSEVELLRRKTPSCEGFFSDPDEQFFVKNLETLQGDERDVIFISIGYARTAEGYLSMGFGPVNRAGGERRLNVLFSRARRRCEVFTSLSSADIDVSRNESLGLYALKTFLHYAEHGQLDVPVYTGGIPQSPFEEQVLRSLQLLGYTVHSQVGSAGFYLDLAIVDPARPGHYILGIECDGAAYHSARSTRDRDRLRQAVLVSMGWKIHRIWSTSWFQNPERELQVLQVAIHAAMEENDSPIPARAQPSETAEPESESCAQAPEPVDDHPASAGTQTVKYQLATLQIDPATTELHAVAQAQLCAWLVDVVNVEGPIHWLEAARRVASAAGVQRMGNRIQDAFKQACASGSRRKLFMQKGDFLWRADGAPPVIRDRSELLPQLKKIECVAPEEIHAAIEASINDSFGLRDEDIATSACRLLGFARVSEEMRTHVDRLRDRLIEQGRLIKRGEVLVCNGAMAFS